MWFLRIIFETETCAIRHCINSDLVSGECVSSILTTKVTTRLPLDWRDISTSNQAAKWLSNRLSDGGFYTIEGTATRDIVGCLFLNEFQSNTDDSELGIGYLLAETYWGKGIAWLIFPPILFRQYRMPPIEVIIGFPTTTQLICFLASPNKSAIGTSTRRQ